MIQSRRARRSIALVALSVLALGVTVAACGDDDDDAAPAATSASSATLSEAEFLEQGNAICAGTNAAIGERLGELFSAGEPSGEVKQEALDFFVAQSDAAGAAIDALAEPTAMTEDVDALLAELDDANAEAASQTGAEFFDTGADPWAGFNELATDLGLDVCAEDDG